MTPGVAGHPFDWHLHLVWLLVVVALIATYLWATSGSSTTPTSVRATGRQRFFFVSGAVLLGLAVTWPLADVAAHWLLVALVLQRLLLTLAVPPLLVLGMPRAPCWPG